MQDLQNGFLEQSLFRILCSIICGALLGLERKSHNHVIGMRTLILITASSTLLSLLSEYQAMGETVFGSVKGDPTRISAGVISGIGFLGGGAIMKIGLNIKGLTSAAIIWTAASFGLAIGAGLYIQVAVSLALALFLLVFLEKLDAKFFPATRSKALHLCFENESINMQKLKDVISKNGLIVTDVNISRVISIKRVIIHFSVKAPKGDDYANLIEELKEIGELSEFSMTD